MIAKYVMLVLKEIMRFPLEKKSSKNNVLFPSMLVTIIENTSGGVQDRVTRTKMLC